jgi:Spy/CpxP family protein refolding chaperone
MMTTSTRRRYGVASGLALMASAALFACAVSSPVPPTAVSSVGVDDDDGLTADLNDHHRHHHQGGVTMFIALSLDTLGLSPEQKAAVATIQSALFSHMEPARVAEQGLLTALADGIAAGAIDKARVDAALAQMESASEHAHEATADALNQLHAQLTPPQRAALVDKVRAQWAVFRHANAEDDPEAKEHPGGRLADLATEIGLSAVQVEKIRMSLQTTTPTAPTAAEDPAETNAHLERLNAFRADTFDAKTLAGGAAANAHIAARGATRMARFYAAVDPALTPEQRPKLAALLREHASHKDAAFVAAH